MVWGVNRQRLSPHQVGWRDAFQFVASIHRLADLEEAGGGV